MKEPNRPSGSSSSGGNQPPTYQNPSAPSGIRPAFTVMGPHIPHGQPLPPPTVARTAPQPTNVPPQQIQLETLLHTLSDVSNLRIEPKVQCLRVSFKDTYFNKYLPSGISR